MTASGDTKETVVIPKDLQTFLGDIIDGNHGFELGEPWKYSENALAVVVPIIRKGAPRRSYKTMYEVLKDIGAKDTGNIDVIELQNKTGGAIFIRTGTILEGGTQNRAVENSGVVEGEKADIKVRCVHQTHGIHRGSKMTFGAIAPMSVTMALIAGVGQSAVWNSVYNYTSGDRSYKVRRDERRRRHDYSAGPGRESPRWRNFMESAEYSPGMGSGMRYLSGRSRRSTARDENVSYCFYSSTRTDGDNVFNTDWSSGTGSGGSDDLLGYMKNVNGGREVLDEMMQKVPLFPEQCGAIIFNPVGVMAIETFDSPKSWEAIKQEVIEKHGDKIMEEQAEHLFELKPEMILPILKKFVKGLEKNKEHIVRKNKKSETRVIIGEGIVGEYTMVNKRVIHAILVREN